MRSLWRNESTEQKLINYSLKLLQIFSEERTALQANTVEEERWKTVMASSSYLLCEDQLQCSICLDVFTNPVSTPCGHNFCMICLRKYWDSTSLCQCPVCKEEYARRPELRVNTFISGLASEFKKSVQVKTRRASVKRSPKRKLVQCDACSEEKLEAVKSCLDCGVSFCDSHLSLHKTTPKYKKHKLMDPVENLEDYICQKHERPLELFCRDDQTCVCQFCTEGDHRTHSTVPIEEESGEKKTQLEKTQAEVQQMIQERLKKIQEIKHSVELNKKIREKEEADSVEIFKALVCCIERSQAELLEVMEEKQKAAERQAEELIKELEQEITELKRRDTELEQISHTEDHLHLLQIYPSLCRPPHTKNWTDVSVNTPLSVESLRRALSQLQEHLREEMEKIVNIELKQVQQYAVDVTLDPDTAHPNLILSDDGKQVKHGDKRHKLADNSLRFDRHACVLGQEGFSSGRFYYEVQVREKTKWIVGVTSEPTNRKGDITLRPENGYWAVCLINENKYVAGEFHPVLLWLKQAPQKVGVFVDYEEGLVSFYDVEVRSHIYSFTGQSFTEKLYPFFHTGLNDGGKNSAPLIITPVQHYK
ncbi:E3 ubiquitin-protein ligase TRIM39-like [Astyanax mexicanus]|uniref:E3 ubiquitin-protein ligase TRIM39-like n=1 Tax=Astyanax mexicanus TaxID=7994 RepID=UPI0020CB0E0B|nr:E3 ubiquitin-protein ligase TRIM39-like [Astyanax mexicanus]